MTEPDFDKELKNLIERAEQGIYEYDIVPEGEIARIHEFKKDLISKNKVIDVIENPKNIMIVLQRTGESFEDFYKRITKAEQNRILKELGLK